MMKSWYPMMAALIMLAGTCWLAAQQVGTEKPEAVGSGEVEGEEGGRFGVYHPDRPQPRPDPIDRETIHATRIVLSGPDVTIVLDADPTKGNPGITLTDRKTGRAVVLYVEPDGRAVVGVRERSMPNLPAALFTNGNAGYLQLRDRAGAEVFRLDELKR